MCGLHFTLGQVIIPITGVDEKKIGSTILIVIQNSHTAPHGFGKQLISIGPIDMFEGNPTLPGLIGKPHLWNSGLCSLGCRRHRYFGDYLRAFLLRPLLDHPNHTPNEKQTCEHPNRPLQSTTNDSIVLLLILK